jgi:Dual OB-containing domain
MRIAVNHLTRMSGQHICVAGVDLETGLHIRPILPNQGRLTRALLDAPFSLGALIDLGAVTPAPAPPRTEDHIFFPANACLVGQLDASDYWRLLHTHAQDSLHAIFDTDLMRRNRNFAVDLHCGNASLGIMNATDRVGGLYINEYGKLRMRLTDPAGVASPSVTDVRLVEADHETIRKDAVTDINARIRRGTPLLLMVGLAYPFQARGDDRERSWLQVNGICLEDKPLGLRP